MTRQKENLNGRNIRWPLLDVIQPTVVSYSQCTLLLENWVGDVLGLIGDIKATCSTLEQSAKMKNLPTWRTATGDRICAFWGYWSLSWTTFFSTFFGNETFPLHLGLNKAHCSLAQKLWPDQRSRPQFSKERHELSDWRYFLEKHRKNKLCTTATTLNEWMRKAKKHHMPLPNPAAFLKQSILAFYTHDCIYHVAMLHVAVRCAIGYTNRVDLLQHKQWPITKNAK